MYKTCMVVGISKTIHQKLGFYGRIPALEQEIEYDYRHKIPLGDISEHNNDIVCHFSTVFQCQLRACIHHLQQPRVQLDSPNVLS